uniref:RNA dependent RNA polymerase n=1 Tax=Rosellinia necatrix partitivirus 12 TaxID=2699380 RepID=A0A6F8QGM0_9VIRU|nr:RNA dependent RNA polymerase [Rosellinia necatrix partitivirus 12]
MQDMNLVRLGRQPVNRRDRRFAERFNTRQQKVLESTIKKAIHKCCNEALARQAIHGYRRSKTDPRSGEVDFLKTDQPYHPVKRDLHYRRALKVTESIFRPTRRLKPIAFPDLRSEGDIEDGRISFHNLYNEIFHENRTHVHQIKNGESPFWKDGKPVPYEYTTLHSRSHLVKEDKPDKIRAVFGVPKLLLMVENMFIWNLQKEYLNEKTSKKAMLWGFETIRGGWMKLQGYLSKFRDNTVLSADWSGFDHKALHEVIDDVHQIWRSWFDFDQGYEPSKSDTHDYSVSETEEWRIQNLWDWMTHAIKHTPIKAESGNMYQWKFNGIASGFQQTQLLDSFVNCVYLLTSLSAAGINILSKSFIALFQGDDSVTSFPEKVQNDIFLHKLSSEAKERFNADLSPDKTTIGTTDDIEVLSYGNKSGCAQRPAAELLAHLLYPERPRTAETTAAAAVGIAQAAMGTSREVYDTCVELFTFLTTQWKVTPEYPERNPVLTHNPWNDFNWKPTKVQTFPSFTETFLQNFDNRVRSENDKQHLWPTVPSDQANGFHFLLD